MAVNDLTVALSRLKTDFTMFAGDDKDLAFSVTEEDGTATTITSAVISFKASKSLRTTAAITKTTVSGITITSGAGGTFTVALDPSDTSSLRGDYYYEVQITFNGTSNVATFCRGVMTIEPGLI